MARASSAAIGRRVCESEWDLFVVLGLAPEVEEPPPAVDPGPPASVAAPFGRPTAAELVAAVREYLEQSVMETADGGERFQARIARNVLLTVSRELELGPAITEAHANRLARLGFDDDRLAWLRLPDLHQPHVSGAPFLITER